MLNEESPRIKPVYRDYVEDLVFFRDGVGQELLVSFELLVLGGSLDNL